MYGSLQFTILEYIVSRLGNNLEQRRDKGMKPLVGILTRLIISEAVVKVLLDL